MSLSEHHEHHGLPHLHSVPPLHEPGDEPGDVVVLDQGEYTRVILHGHIDYRIGDELEEAAGFSLNRNRPVIVDARRVESIDSVGLSAIIRIGAGLRRLHTRLLLQGPCPRLRELLVMVGAEQFVHWLPALPAHPGQAAQQTSPTSHAVVVPEPEQGA